MTTTTKTKQFNFKFSYYFPGSTLGGAGEGCEMREQNAGIVTLPNSLYELDNSDVPEDHYFTLIFIWDIQIVTGTYWMY